MDANEMDNDTRGWIMCTVSGIACVVGASIICVDIPIRLIPSKRNFCIQDSNIFLACSLSLSFGVMLFSALYSMLPSAMRYLTKGEWDKQTAGFIMMGCFVGGFFGIQIVSRFVHQFMPSHVVDCDHTHEDILEDGHPESRSRRMSRSSRSRHSVPRIPSHASTVRSQPCMTEVNSSATESTPLLPTESSEQNGHVRPDLPRKDLTSRSEAALHLHAAPKDSRSRAATQPRRPSMFPIPSRVLSFFKDTKANCDEFGPCYGYSDPCGQECFKHISIRSAISSRHPTLQRSVTGPAIPDVPENAELESTSCPTTPTFHSEEPASEYHDEGENHTHLSHTHTHADHVHEGEDLEAQHHHHVPANAFFSIGLQTVIAIALHKFPEGFITYATNHASPALGFNVFMALFVHNIAEGFAMALPLYMALGSRIKAILWSTLLGGLSQPAGAGIAALWFKLANRSNLDLDNTAYACLFAATAGIMTSVALQLFVESLSLNHNRNLSIFFAFLGMTLLGISNAFVAEH
ncbi:zinc-regulated transporter 3 [Diplogelasinospora grovesii]|uniref:Zinc-regulated transporter 3 n=1 Tax=Diplogelasinospora grovesii TaxID=303347 RepID=A0AAN6NC32_9PEZI|nr:zinc-regulated transporter 3 [Diplogelasinospora grovesii]